jgi:hypothetical protein
MELLILVVVLGFVLHSVNQRDQRVRIALLGRYLGKYQIEKLMENLTQGYLRALGESDAQRQASIWSMLSTAETELCEQFNAFVLDFSNVAEPAARVSKLPIGLPYAVQWLAASTFDMRKVLSLHAHGIAQAATNRQAQSPKGKAFIVMAELFLMQHSCHWFCRSKLVAHARLLARHQTPYDKVLNSVAPQTRQAYCALVGCSR